MDQAGTTVDASTQAIAALAGDAIDAAVTAHEAAANPHPQYAKDPTEPVLVDVKNTSGGSLAKGTPVYVTGSVGDTDVLTVAASDQADPAKGPAIGLLTATLANNATGFVIMMGELLGVDTSGYAVNDELFVAAGGGLTNVKPTSGPSQSVAVVTRSNAVSGSMLVWVAGELPVRAEDGLPTGGDPGNVLLKTGTANYAANWAATLDGGTFN